MTKYAWNDNDRVEVKVIWALNAIDKNYSYKAQEDNSLLLQAMFHDSVIKEKFCFWEEDIRLGDTWAWAVCFWFVDKES